MHALSLDSLLASYIRELRVIRRCSPGYLKRVESHVRTFFSLIAAEAGILSEVVPDPSDPDGIDFYTVDWSELFTVADFFHDDCILALEKLLQMDYADTTLHTMVGAVKSFTLWAHKTGKVSHDPAAGLPMPRVARKAQRVATTADFASMWEQTHTTRWPVRTQLMLALLHGTGIRRQEMMGLELSDLRLKATQSQGTYHVRIVGKAGHERLVPLTAPLVQLLQTYLRERSQRLRSMGYDPREFQPLWITSRRRKRSGSPRLLENAASIELRRLWATTGENTKGVGAHAFRRGFATAGRRGTDPAYSERAMEEQLGHAHATVGHRYDQPTLEDLAVCAARHPHTAELAELLIDEW